MFEIDNKQIKRIIDRSERYPDVSFALVNSPVATYGLHKDMVFSADIEHDHIWIKLVNVDGDYVAQVTLTDDGVTFYDRMFGYSLLVDTIERHQENLINEIKKPLDYKLNKLYKLIFRRIVSKGLYQDHTDKYNVYLIAKSTRKIDTYYRFEFKHPMSGLVLGTVDWQRESGNHKGIYRGDEQTSKNINDIIALLME